MKNHPITSDLVHISYNLHGSLPRKIMESAGQEYHRQKAKLDNLFTEKDRLPSSLRYPDYHAALTKIALRYYLRYDSALDESLEGPMFLESPEAKRIIMDSWHFIAKTHHLVIYAISVMSNHVHIILRAEGPTAYIPFEPLMESHKKYTGTQLNKLQGAKGRRVWAKRVWDRDIRTGKFTSALWYVLNNPKKAGLTNDVLNWHGNYFDPRLEEEYIRPYRQVG